MTAPLFSVNEEVIVVPVDKTLEPFVATITGFIWVEARQSVTKTDCWSYFIAPDTVGRTGRPWAESCLRKKPHPSSQSFDEIMQSIKRPVRVPA